MLAESQKGRHDRGISREIETGFVHLVSPFLDNHGIKEKLLETAISRFGLSTKACDRILKVAGTIEDGGVSEQVKSHRVSEAIQHMTLDRNLI